MKSSPESAIHNKVLDSKTANHNKEPAVTR